GGGEAGTEGEDDGFGEAGHAAINSMLDQVNSCLDDLEEKDEHLHARLQELLESNRQTHLEFQQELGEAPRDESPSALGAPSQAPTLPHWARLWPECSPPGLDTFSGAGLQISWGEVLLPRPPFCYFPWHAWAHPSSGHPLLGPGVGQRPTHLACPPNSWTLPTLPRP
uniref:Uncharacterized protein n=1 Tax=Monodon monoceros TaxID=40151 RepID=A0A8C6C6E0_MONMO